MKKIIRQLTIIIAGGAIALSFGCGIDGLIDDLRAGLKDDVEEELTFAPASFDGKTFRGTVISGTDNMNTSGNFTISFAGTTYYLVDSGGLDSGTYTYTKTSNNTGTVVLAETGAEIVTAVATFTSATAGNYLATAGVDGQETGSFILD